MSPNSDRRRMPPPPVPGTISRPPVRYNNGVPPGSTQPAIGAALPPGFQRAPQGTQVQASPQGTQARAAPEAQKSGTLKWYCSVARSRKDTIEATMIEVANSVGCDTIHINSDVHATTGVFQNGVRRLKPNGDRERQYIGLHVTAYFGRSSTDKYQSSHVFTDKDGHLDRSRPRDKNPEWFPWTGIPNSDAEPEETRAFTIRR